MVDTHGDDWSQQLLTLRAELQPTIHRLRRRSSGPTGQQRGVNIGGMKKVKGKGKRRGARGINTTIPDLPSRGTSSVPAPTSPSMELLRDANAGASVLGKLCNSTWWDWSRGSTLIFW
jgi:hypothetical protein